MEQQIKYLLHKSNARKKATKTLSTLINLSEHFSPLLTQPIIATNFEALLKTLRKFCVQRMVMKFCKQGNFNFSHDFSFGNFALRVEKLIDSVTWNDQTFSFSESFHSKNLKS